MQAHVACEAALAVIGIRAVLALVGTATFWRFTGGG